jgi:hypothetical protein
MAQKDENRQDLIRQAIARDESGTPAGILAHAHWLWRRLAGRLTPLIGDAGFCALFGRTIRLAIPRFNSLTIPEAGRSIDSLFETLKGDLMSVDAHIAVQASRALLDIFTGLLSTLIGDALTIRVLRSAWFDEADSMNKQETRK